jgi:Ca2+-binding RTX toxin-like protein
VTADLSAGSGSDGDANGDTFTSIENLTGSAYDDTFVGDSLANVLTGNGGNDTLTGGDGSDTFVYGDGDGNDTVFGGAGAGWTDTIALQNADGSAITAGWTINLTSGSVVSNHGTTMTLSQDSAGTITLQDGSEITFDGIEQVTQ